MSRISGRLTYSRVVSTVALFVALGGSAYAFSLGKGDVNSRIIKNGSVKSADVMNDGIKGKDILERSLDLGQLGAVASSGPSQCDPEITAVCGGTTIETPIAGRVFATASGELISQAASTAASCRLTVDGETVGQVPDRARTSPEFGFAVSGVSARVLPAGPHAVELTCIEGGGEVQVQVYGVSAVEVGGS